MQAPQKNRITFLLGAGASKNACLPICSDFASIEYFEYLSNLGFHPNNFGWEEIKDICNLIKNSQFSFEEYIADAYLNCKDEYFRLVRFYESTLLAGESAGGLCINQFTGSYYSRYYWILAKIIKTNKWDRAVITFNHDLWLEHSFDWIDFTYGSISKKSCGVSNFPIRYSQEFEFLNESNPIPILKLHGSFNYLLCESCSHLVIGTDYLWGSSYFFKCQNCGSPVIPYYVPPLKNKEVNLFEETWKDAEIILSETNQLIIAGYSLPEYDFKAKELLLNYLNPDAQILILDKYADSISKNYLFLKNEQIYFRDMEFADALNLLLERNSSMGVIDARKTFG